MLIDKPAGIFTQKCDGKLGLGFWLVWRGGNGVVHINDVKLRQTRLVLGLVTTFDVYAVLVFSRPLRLSIPLWAVAMISGSGFRHSCGRNALFYVAVGHGTRTVGILQGSHASWKVLHFFLEIRRTWRVMESHLSWKVLEING